MPDTRRHIENWPRIRNAIKKRLWGRVETGAIESGDLEDCVQDACVQVMERMSEDFPFRTNVGLLVVQSVVRVLRLKRRESALRQAQIAGEEFQGERTEPLTRENRWKEPDYAGTLWYLSNRPGTSAYSSRSARGNCSELLGDLSDLDAIPNYQG